MNQQENIRKIFNRLTADPSSAESGDLDVLKEYVEKYPYAQLIRSFHAAAVKSEVPDEYENALFAAALVSPDRTILYKIIEHPELLAGDLSEILAAPSHTDEPAAELAENTVAELSEIYPEISEIEDVKADVADKTDTDELDLLIRQNIAQTDYVPEAPQAENSRTVPFPEISPVAAVVQAAAPSKKQNVSRYDDDRMPYSFLWWLHKTRKEHADTYQPYVNFTLDTSERIRDLSRQGDPLSEQIIENIFHLQSPIEDLEANPRTVPFQVQKKEQAILEKFIREEPQIKPPNPEKLDTENKARKSSEDSHDLVSETLANIYAEQMLYHKAIETYRKLSLKFPEKSAYFADRIGDLEKKVN